MDSVFYGLADHRNISITTYPANIRLDEDVFKTSCKNVFKTASRRLQDVLKTSSKRLQDVLNNVFKTSSRHLQDVLQRYLQDVFKTYHQVKLFLLTSL